MEILQKLKKNIFLHLSYKNTQLLFFVAVLFNIFMKQTLTDDFSWLPLEE